MMSSMVYFIVHPILSRTVKTNFALHAEVFILMHSIIDVFFLVYSCFFYKSLLKFYISMLVVPA